LGNDDSFVRRGQAFIGATAGAGDQVRDLSFRSLRQDGRDFLQSDVLEQRARGGEEGYHAEVLSCSKWKIASSAPINDSSSREELGLRLTDCHCADGVRGVPGRNERLYNGETSDNVASRTGTNEDGVAIYLRVWSMDIDCICYVGLKLLLRLNVEGDDLHISAEPTRTSALPMMYHGDM